MKILFAKEDHDFAKLPIGFARAVVEIAKGVSGIARQLFKVRNEIEISQKYMGFSRKNAVYFTSNFRENYITKKEGKNGGVPSSLFTLNLLNTFWVL